MSVLHDQWMFFTIDATFVLRESCLFLIQGINKKKKKQSNILFIALNSAVTSAQQQVMKSMNKRTVISRLKLLILATSAKKKITDLRNNIWKTYRGIYKDVQLNVVSHVAGTDNAGIHLYICVPILALEMFQLLQSKIDFLLKFNLHHFH